MRKIDDVIIKITDKYLDWIVFFFLLILSIFIRYKYIGLLDFYNGETDYNNYLLPWTNTYVEKGIVGGLRENVGNYYVPYNVFLAIISKLKIAPYIPIGLLSISFDYLIAICVYKIVITLQNYICLSSIKYIKCFAVAFTLIPMVIENSAMWKQCDAIYSGFIFLSILYFLKDRYSIAFILVGVAFSFKLQAIFIIPFYIIAYFKKRNFSIANFLFIPLMYIIGGIPAILCGRSVIDTFSTYFGQTSENHNMKMNFATVYTLGMEDETVFFDLALVIPIVIFVFAFKYLYQKKINDDIYYLYLAAWSVMTCVMFLPGMHERYDYLSILLFTVCAVFFRRKLVCPTIAMYVIAACTYGKCFYGFEPNYQLLAVVYLAVYIYISHDLTIVFEDDVQNKSEEMGDASV